MKLSRISAPTCAERSGWNCVPKKLPLLDHGRERHAVARHRAREVADRRRVAVDEVRERAGLDARRAARESATTSSWFQPICGTGKSALCGSLLTRASMTPRHLASSSSEPANRSCMPRQMPSTGCVSVGTSSASPAAASRAMPGRGRADAGQDHVGRAPHALADLRSRARRRRAARARSRATRGSTRTSR